MRPTSPLQQDTQIKPAHIHAPADAVPARSPAVTRTMDLPFGDLSWENFEKLCFRLAGRGADAEHWETYGRRGQAQGGIDVFVRRQDGLYDVWQAKRYERFGKKQVKDAVDIFLTGEWKDRTSILVLCVQARLDDVSIQQEIEAQASRLKSLGIVLKPMGGNRLSEELRKHPDLIDDFFGREWVKAVCGPEAAEDLSHRLDGADIANLRRKLLTLYQSHFETLDPGLVSITSPAPNTSGAPDLLERYIVPDILAREGTIPRQSGEEQVQAGDTGIEDLGSAPQKLSSENRRRSPVIPIERTDRQPVATWLIEGPRAVILGDAGLGKSTLLRCLALDLLSGRGIFPEVTRAWGTYLPVIIPFAFWTRLVERQDRGVRLEEAVRLWIEQFSPPNDLVALITRALEDRRLLLLVDGLDEWANDTAARTVLTQLETVVKMQQVTAVLTGRPLGVAKLGSLGHTWRTATLTPLSEQQQHRLAQIWFGHPSVSLPDAPDEAGGEVRAKFIEWRIDAFFKDLRDGGRLTALAGIPLLLVGLISLAIRRLSLPRNRFQAYAELTRLLLEEHPQRRSSAASSVAERFKVLRDSSHRLRALARLASTIRKVGGDSGFPLNEAKRIVYSFLQDEDELGLTADQARVGVDELLAVNAETTGLLIEKARGLVGFVHAAFEEYLSAVDLSARSFDEQAKFVSMHCTDPRWRNVILGLLAILNRPSDVDALLKQIQAAEARGIGELSRRLLLAEAAFGEGNRSARLAREVANDILERIETGPWMPEREVLLRVALDGLTSGTTQGQVRQHLARWYPDSLPSRGPVYAAMADWPHVPEVTASLLRGLHDEDERNSRHAGRALAKVAKGQDEIGRRLASVVCSPVEPSVAAAALEALAIGWPTWMGLDELIEQGRHSASPYLQLISIRVAIERKHFNDDDREALLDMASAPERLSYAYSGELAEILGRCWPRDQAVFNACWDAWTKHEWRSNGMDRQIATLALLQGYNDDERVAKHLAGMIRNGEHFFLGFSDRWQFLRDTFKRNTLIGPACDEWLKRYGDKPGSIRDAEYAAATSGSNFAKNFLLQRLKQADEFVFWPAWGLLDAWGMQDADVAQALLRLAAEEPERIQFVAHHLSAILSDKSECRKRLLEIARLEKPARMDFVVKGFSRLGIDHTDREVVEAILKQRSHFGPLGDAEGSVITAFGLAPDVKDLARQALGRRTAPLAAMARAYGGDPEMRALVIARATPLPINMRLAIVEHARRRSRESDDLRRVLSNFDAEMEPAVRTAACFGHAEVAHRDGGNLSETEAKFVEEAQAIGPEMDARRQAAFAGMLALGRLKTFVRLSERTGAAPLSLPILSSFSRNDIILAQVARHWSIINDVLGKENLKRLAKRGGDSTRMWEELSPYLGTSESLRDAFLDHCRSPKVVLGSVALDALARVMPRSSLLLEHCTNILEDPDASTALPPPDEAMRRLTAGQLIGMHFQGDHEVYTRLVSLLQEQPSEGVLVGLCIGWPETQVLDEAFAATHAGTAPQPLLPTLLYLYGAKADTKSFLDLLARILANAFGNIWEFLPKCVEPVVRRLTSDDLLVKQMVRKLRDGPTTDEAASLPRLLAAAGRLESEGRDWCGAEYERQTAIGSLSETGLDIVANRFRPVAHALLDVLMPFETVGTGT